MFWWGSDFLFVVSADSCLWYFISSWVCEFSLWVQAYWNILRLGLHFFFSLWRAEIETFFKKIKYLVRLIHPSTQNFANILICHLLCSPGCVSCLSYEVHQFWDSRCEISRCHQTRLLIYWFLISLWIHAFLLSSPLNIHLIYLSVHLYWFLNSEFSIFIFRSLFYCDIISIW